MKKASLPLGVVTTVAGALTLFSGAMTLTTGIITIIRHQQQR